MRFVRRFTVSRTGCFVYVACCFRLEKDTILLVVMMTELLGRVKSFAIKVCSKRRL